MVKQKLGLFYKGTKKYVVDNLPLISLVVGISGWCTTAYLVAKETPKYHEVLEEERRKLGDARGKLPAKTIVKSCIKCYSPAFIMGALSTACLISGNTISQKRNAVLAAACKLSETALSEYKDAVIETIGEKKEKIVREKVSEKQLEKNPASKAEVYVTGKGETLCYEPLSGRYFKSDAEQLRKIENELNYRLIHHMYISLNEVYVLLGLSTNELGAALGWNMDRNGYIKIDFDAKLTDKNEPCLVVDFSDMPIYDFSLLEY